jgi:hypothetical protein
VFRRHYSVPPFLYTNGMKHLFIFLLVGTYSLVPTFAFAETLSSENFELHDKSGRLTAQLTTSSDGTPAFFIYDQNGVPRVSIGLYPDGAPGVVLNDDKGLAGAIMRLVNNNGEPVVVLKENGQDRYIIRKDGPSFTAVSPMMVALLTLLFAMIGSALTTLYILKKRLPLAQALPQENV